MARKRSKSKRLKRSKTKRSSIKRSRKRRVKKKRSKKLKLKKEKRRSSSYANIEDVELATSKIRSMMDESIKKSKKPSVTKVARQLNKDSKRIAKKQNVPIRTIQNQLISNVNSFCRK
jgi:hypothetical protein